MTRRFLSALALVGLTSFTASAAVRFVNLNNPTPAAPFTSWATAATNIQDAIDSCTAGDEVVVTNGVYQAGGRAVYGTLINRVVVDKPITVRSVNGAAVTVIAGNPEAGDNAVRCVYLTNNAVLAGFTLTNGATRTDGDPDQEQRGGGVWCESISGVVSNCVLIGNWANNAGGGAFGGTLNNCTLSTNSAPDGGGAWGSTLNGCTFSGNSAGGSGGGANAAVLNNCLLIGNTAGNYGGGACGSALTNCTLTGNTTFYGGGAESSTLNNCALTGNLAYAGGGASGSTLIRCTLTDNSGDSFGSESAGHGGGADGGTLIGCILTGNFAAYGGGANGASLINCAINGNIAAGDGAGANSCSLTNCTVTGNSAGGSGGGVSSSALGNCIVYYNTASQGPNYSASTFAFSCAQPLPPGTGNTAAEPRLSSPSHLSAGSPCRGAGSAAYVSGVDVDGQPWLNPPAIGCDEFYSGGATGLLTVAIQAAETNAVAGAALDFTAVINGNAGASRWDFGDGTIVSNLPYASHSWAVAGDYVVVLRAYNDSFPSGVSATTTVHVVPSSVQYVALQNVNPVAPYTSWATAATNIQDAVDAAVVGGTILVSNGVYQTGERLVFGFANRVAVTRAVKIQSVNGPGSVVINAGYPVRGVYLAAGASWSGITVSNGWSVNGGGAICASSTTIISNCVFGGCSANSGGGVFGGTIDRCLLTGNFAHLGGGACSATLTRCTIFSNSASYYGIGLGGGAYSSTLSGCTLTGNSADYAGGASLSTLNNCALTLNQANGNGGAAEYCTLRNCTVTGNSAQGAGGGTSSGTNYNSVLFYNSAPSGSNYSGGTFSYCCTTPLPAGAGNFTTEPQLASASHLSAGSPCRAAGNAALTIGVDIDGEAWLNPPSIGCDEFYAGVSSGPLTVSFQMTFTNVAGNFDDSFTGNISGYCDASRWEFGDGTILSNRPYATHAWLTPGDYPVVLRAFNGSFPGGVTATQIVHVLPPVLYVFAGNSTPVAPFGTWATAATNIQDAVDIAAPGITITVSNGFYQFGGRNVNGSNRVAVTISPLRLQSVNGAAATIVSGMGAARCAYLVAGVELNGFTLTNGTANDGAGVYSELQYATVANCSIVGNAAGGTGGGVLNCSLSNCVVNGNAAYNGAGAASSRLVNCTVNGNTLGFVFYTTGGGLLSSAARNCVINDNRAWYGGGALYCTLDNCALTNNVGGGSGGGAQESILNNCTLASNSSSPGGGVHASMVTNCIFSGNFANFGGAANASTLVNCSLIGNQGDYGGGANSCTLINCILYGNFCFTEGGGANACDLVNCSVSGNTANQRGGGVNAGTIRNSIVYFNSSPNGPNWFGGLFDYSCTTPQPTNGIGNIINNPLLVNQGAGNFRLQTTSPCINAGRNAYVVPGPDLDGNPRIAGGTVDMGAYEFQSPTSTISYEWLQRFGLPLNGSADSLDSDGDGHRTWEEWRADTNPNNSLSVLRLTTISNSVPGLAVTWQSVATRNYSVGRTSALGGPPSFVVVGTNIVGQANFTTWQDTNAVGQGPFFYRVAVQE